MVTETKGWRPEGWENRDREYFEKNKNASNLLPDDYDYINECEIRGDAYEAGADAMYNALWKMAEESPTKTFTLDANVVNLPSVFISEEEK